MEKLDSKINAWLRDHLIPRLAEVFQERCSPNDVEYTVTRPRGSFYLSSLFFASIRFPERERRVVVKLPCQDPTLSRVQDYSRLFTNEILFYEMLGENGTHDYPRYYLGTTNDPVFQNILVLEDVSLRGFADSPTKVNVPLDYLKASLKAIARFHGNTYTLKERDPDKFNKIVSKIDNVRYTENKVNEIMVDSFNTRIKRVTRTLQARNCDLEFTKKIINLFDDCFTNIMLNSVKPVEPLATIIHGDTTLNNIMFRKVKNNQGEELEAMLIDFAMIMYSSPAIDLSTFLYMSCAYKDIKDNSEKFIGIYHEYLSEYMKERGIWNPTKYSFETFWKDYKKHAMFGYVISTFFLAMMNEYEINKDILQASYEEMCKINMNGGGDEFSNTLVDMLLDMRDHGMLDSYM